MNRYILISWMIFLPYYAYAVQTNHADVQEQKLMLQRAVIKADTLDLEQPNLSLPQNQPIQPILDKQNISQQPELLAYLLHQALNTNNANLIQELYQNYQTIPHADLRLLQRAEGTLARLTGDLKHAIHIYQTLAQSHPQDNRIQLDLASMLQQDKQWKEAEAIFTQQQQQHLPDTVQYHIQRHLNTIAQHRQWQWDIGISPVYEQNINNVAKPYCNQHGMCSQEQPQTGLGIDYFAEISKNTPLKHHHNIQINSQLNGRSYYLAKQSSYDYLQWQSSIAWQWQNHRHQWAIEPIYRLTLSGTANWDSKPQNNHTFTLSPWQHTLGLKIAYHQKITPNWQIGFSSETRQLHYRHKPYAASRNGVLQSWLLNTNWQHPNIALYSGIQLTHFQPKQSTIRNQPNHHAYQKYTFYAGIIKQWQWQQLITQAQFTWGQRTFSGKWLNEELIRSKRQDIERSYNLNIWSPKFTIGQWQPKLKWSYQSIHSSHQWAKRQASQVVLSLERTK